MATPLDILFVALFTVLLPAYDYIVSWPANRRRLQADPARAKLRIWQLTIASQWAVVAIGSALWLYQDRSWTLFGLSVPDGWRLWASVSLVVLAAVYVAQTIVTVAHDAAVRANVRKQMGDISFTALAPQTRVERDWFVGVALTAGFCEEFLFRGYFIWAFAPWIGWWGAAGLALLLFAGWHAYQGWSGVLRVGIVGALYTVIVAVCDSLWPAIALHALMDVQGGILSWLATREAQPGDDVAQVEPQPASRVESNPVSAGPDTPPDTARSVG